VEIKGAIHLEQVGKHGQRCREAKNVPLKDFFGLKALSGDGLMVSS
jgi:hypothetical protein